MKKHLLRSIVALTMVLSLVLVAIPAFAGTDDGSSSVGQENQQVFGPWGTLKDLSEIFGMTIDELREAKKSGKTLAEIAGEKGLTVGDLVQKVLELREARIEQLVQEGKITEETASKILERMNNNVLRALFHKCREMYRKRLDGLRVFGPQGLLKDISQVLGITVDELREAKKSGKTFAEIADEKGLTVDELAQKILELRKARLDELVQQGKITQEIADKIFGKMSDRISKVLSKEHLGQCQNGSNSGWRWNRFHKGRYGGDRAHRGMGQGFGAGRRSQFRNTSDGICKGL